MIPSKKILVPEIKELISKTLKQFRWNCRRDSSRTEGYAILIDKGLPLNKFGIHIQLNNFRQWIIFLSVTFSRSRMSYEGMAYCQISVCNSYELLIKWLSYRSRVNNIYNEICELSNSYFNNMWTEIEAPYVPEKSFNETGLFETWYSDLVSGDPLCFVERNKSLTNGLHKLMLAHKTFKAYTDEYKYGEYFTYVLYSQDTLKRKEYILQHDEALRKSIHNFQEPVLQEMQNVGCELCERAYHEFNPEINVNNWDDNRYGAGIRVEKRDVQKYVNMGETPLEEYYCWIRLQIPDGLYFYEHVNCKNTAEVKDWLKTYSQKQWILDRYTVEVYEDFIEDNCLGLPHVYENFSN